MDRDIGRKVITEPSESGNLGEITIEKNKKGDGYFLRNLFVRQEHRGKGIGSKLLDEAIKQADGKISLEVEESNTTAVNLYQKKRL
jgi:ribosomal protein S18 acetylase RimI-like enzyme